MKNRADLTTGPDISDLDDSEAETEQQEPRVKHMDGMSQALTLYPVREDDLDEDAGGLDVDEIAEVESTILGTLDRAPASSSQEVWEDLGSVLRKVVRHAEEVHQASADLPSQTVPRSSATESHPPSFHNENGDLVSREVPVAGSRGNTSVDSVAGNVNDRFLKVKNIDGRTYLFPYDTVRDWDVSIIS